MAVIYLPQHQSAWDQIGQGLLKGWQQSQENKRYGNMLDAAQKMVDTPLPQQQAITGYQEAKNIVNDPQYSFLKNDPIDQRMSAEVMNEATQGVQKFFPNWQPTQAPDTAGYKTAIQGVVDKGGEGLLSGLGAVAKQYGDIPTLKNDLTYALGGDTGKVDSLMQGVDTSPRMNALPTVGLQDQVSFYKKQIPAAAKELLAKGYNPKDFMPILQQAANDKVTEVTNNYNKNQSDTLLQGFNSARSLREAGMYAAQLKKYGIDIPAEVLKNWNPKYTYHLVNQGDKTSLVAANENDPTKSGVVGEFTTGLSPYQSGQLKIGQQNADANTMKAQASMISANKPPKGGGSSKPNGKTSTGLTLQQFEKANGRYDEILEDIWDSSTPQERVMKANSYKDELNVLGQALDKDVANDVNYIMEG